VIFVIDAAKKKHSSEWFGFWSMETGEWAYYDTKFSKAVKTPDSLIIIKNFGSMSVDVIQGMMNLFQGGRSKMCVYPPHSPSSRSFLSLGHDWVYGCSKGVKFWLLGVNKTDPAWTDKLISNPCIEHME
jgi:hypothetical protein